MDFPVEATVCLDGFRDETKVRELLRSHDFVVWDLNSNQVRVSGSFLKLRAVKGRLEQLQNAEHKKETSPRHYSPGAVPKSRSGSGGHRGRVGSSEGSPSWSNPAPSPWTSGSSHRHPHPPPAASLHRQGSESFIVDADVYKYAKKLRDKDIVAIVESHNVQLAVDELGDSFNIRLQGRSARTAISKLQSLLNNLALSLRTQEVPRRELDREGVALLEMIRRKGNVYNSVLVCEMPHSLHLIGPSSESYKMKQGLQGRAGRTAERTSQRRSSSLPPGNRQSSGAFGYSAPAGAAGYSPSKYQDYIQEGARVYQGQIGAPRNQSYTSHAQRGESGNRSKPPSMKQPLVNYSDKLKPTSRNPRK